VTPNETKLTRRLAAGCALPSTVASQPSTLLVKRPTVGCSDWSGLIGYCGAMPMAFSHVSTNIGQ